MCGEAPHGRPSWTVSISRLAVARRGRRFNLRIPSAWTAIFRILVTPDGKAYCHDYVRVLSELFIVEGLK